jgi:hypothetical protein
MIMKLHSTVVAVVIACFATQPVNARVGYKLGYIEIDMGSTQTTPTNELLRTVLSATTNFISSAFYAANPMQYPRVSCSLKSYNTGGSAVNDDKNSKASTDTAPYTALITITGNVVYDESTNWNQTNVTDFVSSIFDSTDGHQSFLNQLQKESNGTQFLLHLTNVAVRVDGDLVTNEINDGSSNENKIDDGADAKSHALEVWTIALIGGLGAFLLVICAVLTCICCIPLDDDEAANAKSQKNQLGQHGTNPTQTDSKMDEHIPADEIDQSPSEAKSIGSQDSSLFTYNPKSVRSYDSRKSFNSYFTYGTTTQGVEMDVAAWHANPVRNNVPTDDYGTTSADTSMAAHQVSFGQDISAIEAKKGDLSLIQEDEENESAVTGSVSVASMSVASSDVETSLPTFHIQTLSQKRMLDDEHNNRTVASASPSRASGKYKSLLASITPSKSISTAGVSGTSIAQQYLTRAAQRDMEADDDHNLVEIYSRDSLSSGSNASRPNKKNTNLMQQPLPTAAQASRSIPTQTQNQGSHPVAIYDYNQAPGRNSDQYSQDNPIMCRPSDEESNDETSYGPSYFAPQPRLPVMLRGTASDVLNDLNDLSTQIDEIRNSHSSGHTSISGRAAIRLRR